MITPCNPLESVDTPFHWDEAQAKVWLRGKLSEKRYFHSLGVYEKACDIAKMFQLAEPVCHKVAAAALLHDAAKLQPAQELLAYAETHMLPVDEVEREQPHMLHPWVGAHWVESQLGVDHSEVLDAIRFHTTARAGMTCVEKVVYIADKIEENTRDPQLTQEASTYLIPSKGMRSIDRTLLFLLDRSLLFLLQHGKIIHPRTIDARNDCLRRIMIETDLNSRQL